MYFHHPPNGIRVNIHISCSSLLHNRKASDQKILQKIMSTLYSLDDSKIFCTKVWVWGSNFTSPYIPKSQVSIQYQLCNRDKLRCCCGAGKCAFAAELTMQSWKVKEFVWMNNGLLYPVIAPPAKLNSRLNHASNVYAITSDHYLFLRLFAGIWRCKDRKSEKTFVWSNIAYYLLPGNCRELSQPGSAHKKMLHARRHRLCLYERSVCLLPIS